MPEPVVTVTTVLRCRGCGEHWTHVEAWVGDDEPLGLPDCMMRCPECGGDLLAELPPFRRGGVVPLH